MKPRTHTPTGTPIPPHDPTPACRLGLCNACSKCGRAHHGGGDECIGCWVRERTTGAKA